jgi:hypothetical protein
MSDGQQHVAQTERMKKFTGKPPEPGEAQPGLERREQKELLQGQTEREIETATKRERAPFVLIENTSAKLHGIGLPTKKIDGQVQGVPPVDPEVKLLPGMNKVAPAAWATALEQKMVQVHLKAGIFREFPGADALSDIHPADAIRLIPKTFDKKLLTEWQQTDARPDIQDLLKKQFELLKAQHRDGDDGYQAVT